MNWAKNKLNISRKRFAKKNENLCGKLGDIDKTRDSSGFWSQVNIGKCLLYRGWRAMCKYSSLCCSSQYSLNTRVHRKWCLLFVLQWNKQNNSVMTVGILLRYLRHYSTVPGPTGWMCICVCLCVCLSVCLSAYGYQCTIFGVLVEKEDRLPGAVSLDSQRGHILGFHILEKPIHL